MREAEIIRCNQRSQFAPLHLQVHLIEKHALARSHHRKLESAVGQADLFHQCLTFRTKLRLSYADLPYGNREST